MNLNAKSCNFNICIFREASNIGYSIFNFLNLFFPTHHRENEFTKFCQDIYEESKKESKNVYNGGNLNFFEILLKNKNFLSKQEIQDEVSTMILAVSANIRSVINFKLFSATL